MLPGSSIPFQGWQALAAVKHQKAPSSQHQKHHQKHQKHQKHKHQGSSIKYQRYKAWGTEKMGRPDTGKGNFQNRPWPLSQAIETSMLSSIYSTVIDN
jgi:hypothetical protein